MNIRFLSSMIGLGAIATSGKSSTPKGDFNKKSKHPFKIFTIKQAQDLLYRMSKGPSSFKSSTDPNPVYFSLYHPDHDLQGYQSYIMIEFWDANLRPLFGFCLEYEDWMDGLTGELSFIPLDYIESKKFNLIELYRKSITVPTLSSFYKDAHAIHLREDCRSAFDSSTLKDTFPVVVDVEEELINKGLGTHLFVIRTDTSSMAISDRETKSYKPQIIDILERNSIKTVSRCSRVFALPPIDLSRVKKYFEPGGSFLRAELHVINTKTGIFIPAMYSAFDRVLFNYRFRGTLETVLASLSSMDILSNWIDGGYKAIQRGDSLQVRDTLAIRTPPYQVAVQTKYIPFDVKAFAWSHSIYTRRDSKPTSISNPHILVKTDKVFMIIMGLATFGDDIKEFLETGEIPKSLVQQKRRKKEKQSKRDLPFDGKLPKDFQMLSSKGLTKSSELGDSYLLHSLNKVQFITKITDFKEDYFVLGFSLYEDTKMLPWKLELYTKPFEVSGTFKDKVVDKIPESDLSLYSATQMKFKLNPLLSSMALTVLVSQEDRLAIGFNTGRVVALQCFGQMADDRFVRNPLNYKEFPAITLPMTLSKSQLSLGVTPAILQEENDGSMSSHFEISGDHWTLTTKLNNATKYLSNFSPVSGSGIIHGAISSQAVFNLMTEGKTVKSSKFSNDLAELTVVWENGDKSKFHISGNLSIYQPNGRRKKVNPKSLGELISIGRRSIKNRVEILTLGFLQPDKSMLYIVVNTLDKKKGK